MSTKPETITVEEARRLVDLTWGRAMEDGSVPSTKIVNELLAQASPPQEQVEPSGGTLLSQRDKP